MPAKQPRSKAKQGCATRNGTGSGKTPHDPLSIEHRLKRGESTTFGEIDAIDRLSRANRHPPSGPLDPDIYGKLRLRRLLAEEQQRREIVADSEQWLPGALTAWGAAVAEHYGYGGAKRKEWPTYRIIDAWQATASAYDVLETTLKPSIKSLHRMIWPAWRSAGWDDSDRCCVLVVHFLSADPARLKAEYFGVEKRAYLNQVKAAYQRLARGLISDGATGMCRSTMGSSYCWAETWDERISQEESWERVNERPAARRARNSPALRRAAPRGRAIGMTPTESAMRERMDQLKSAFGRQFHHETTPAGAGAVKNERPLSEEGINPSDKI